MIYDISPPVNAGTPVWPGDQPFSRKVNLRQEDGDSVLLSSIETTVHVGAHADAPNHYRQEGAGIDAVDLDPYIGPCEVVGVPKTMVIQIEHCERAVSSGATRILFRTNSFRHDEPFSESFCHFSDQAVRFMGQNGVRLIGIDTPSVDAFSSKELPAHNQLFEHDMRNLEGLDLAGVPDGPYELIALPLKLEGLDASPVRAIVRRR